MPLRQNEIYNAIVQENAISIFPPIRISTKRKFAHRLLRFGFPHLQQAVEEDDIFSFVIKISSDTALAGNIPIKKDLFEKDTRYWNTFQSGVFSHAKILNSDNTKRK